MSFRRRLASSKFPRSRNRSRGRLLVLRFVLIVTMFSFVLANNEVSQGGVLSHSSHFSWCMARMQLVEAVGVQVFRIDKWTRASCRSMAMFVARQKNRAWAVSSWV
jgi:hypothetical protein